MAAATAARQLRYGGRTRTGLARRRRSLAAGPSASRRRQHWDLRITHVRIFGEICALSCRSRSRCRYRFLLLCIRLRSQPFAQTASAIFSKIAEIRVMILPIGNYI